MTCVGISRKWNELNFMGTDDVISSNVFMLDDDVSNTNISKKLCNFQAYLRFL